MDPAHYSVTFLESLPTEQLLQLTRRVISTLAISRLLLGRCLVAIDNVAADEVGCSGAIHYAILHGIDVREAWEARRVACRLEQLPLLREAAEAGGVDWASLREIVRKATVETEERWLELASRLCYRKIERIVRRTRAGDMPSEDSGVESDPIETLLKVRLSPEDVAVMHRVMRLQSRDAGRAISFKESLVAFWAEYLAGSASEEAVEKIWEEAAKDVAAQEPARVQEAPWAAVAADEEECPEVPGLKLVQAAAVPHWTNDRLRFSGQARGVTPAQRQEVMRRDGYCCSTPGCPNRLWMEVHHVVFYCRGGATVPENLAVMCSKCHANLHKGWLRLSGFAPGGLVWKDRWGSALGGTRSGEWLGLLAADLDTG